MPTEQPGSINSAMLASMENAQQHSGGHSGAATSASSGGTFGAIVTGNIDNEYGHVSGNLGAVTNLGSVDSLIPVQGPNGAAVMSDNPFTSFFDQGNMAPCILYPGLGAEFKADNMGFGSVGVDNIGFVKQTNANIPRLSSGGQQGH